MRRAARILTQLVATVVVTSCSLFDWLESKPAPGAKVLWTVADAGFITPAFDSVTGTVYFLANDHRVVALDLDGKKRWEGRTFDGQGHSFGFGGCAVAGDLVVCNDTGLVALRRSDGARIWQFIPDVGKYPGYAGFVVAGDVIYAGSPSGHVYGIDAATGALRWVQRAPPADSTSNVNVTGLTTDGQRVYAPFTQFVKPERGGVMALDAATGQVAWTVNFPRPAPDSLTGAVSSELWTDVVLTSCADGRIYAMNRATGAIQWSLPGVGNGGTAELGGPYGADLRALRVSGSTLYAGSLSAWLIAYDLPARAERWRYSLGGSDEALRPTVAGDVIYEETLGGGFKAISSTGHLIWSLSASTERFIGAPAVAADRVFMAGTRGFWAIAR